MCLDCVQQILCIIFCELIILDLMYMYKNHVTNKKLVHSNIFGLQVELRPPASKINVLDHNEYSYIHILQLSTFCLSGCHTMSYVKTHILILCPLSQIPRIRTWREPEPLLH